MQDISELGPDRSLLLVDDDEPFLRCRSPQEKRLQLRDPRPLPWWICDFRMAMG